MAVIDSKVIILFLYIITDITYLNPSAKASPFMVSLSPKGNSCRARTILQQAQDEWDMKTISNFIISRFYSQNFSQIEPHRVNLPLHRSGWFNIEAVGLTRSKHQAGKQAIKDTTTSHWREGCCPCEGEISVT